MRGRYFDVVHLAHDGRRALVLALVPGGFHGSSDMGDAPVATKHEESDVRVPDSAKHGHARSLGLRPEKIHFTPHTLDVVDGRLDARSVVEMGD